MASNCRWKRPGVFGAYDVGKTRRLAQVVVAVIYCFLSSGIIFGYAALKPALIEEGVYSHLCTKDEINQGVRVCYHQELRLNLMFTASAIATNICALPIGAILDKYGPRFTGGLGAVLLAMGSLLFSSASHFPYDRHLCGYILLAMGGPTVFISSFHLSNAFPKHSGLILSTLTAAFDGSSALFLLFGGIHGTKLTLKILFLLYLFVPGLILGCQVFLMPLRPYSTVGELVGHAEDILAEEMEDDRINAGLGLDSSERSLRYQQTISKIKTLLDEDDCRNITGTWNVVPGREAEQTGGTRSSRVQHAKNPLWGTLHALPASEQVSSLWFILLTVFAMGQFLRINYFISTLCMQYEHLLSSLALAKTLNHVFDYLLPLGGLISVPFIGLFLDYATLPVILLSLVAMTTIIGIAGCIPHSLAMGYINIILFTLYRPYFYTVVSDYAAKIFGFQTFGKVYGLIIFAASMGSFFQTPLEMMTLNEYDGDPIPVNILMTAGTFLAGGVLVLFVWHKSAVYGYPALPSEIDIESSRDARAAGNAQAPAEDEFIAENDSSANDECDAWQTDPLLRSFDRLDRALSYGAIPHDA
ncbi:hypothetical protein FQN49_003964 [Arthroderma sp. PD_2]|nr:hypothetical protein FQN49_003964 [Arthroderma sp. PD_2]